MGRRDDRIVKLGVLVAVVVGAVVVASATLGAPEIAPSSQPVSVEKAGRATLVLANDDPLRVRGAQFKAGERVRVTADDGSAPARKMVTASSTGSFVVGFTGVETCSLTVSAVGDRGSRTSFQLSSFTCD